MAYNSKLINLDTKCIIEAHCQRGGLEVSGEGKATLLKIGGWKLNSDQKKYAN